MPEIHVRQPGFTYSTCGPYTKNRERIPNFKETGGSLYIYIYIYIGFLEAAIESWPEWDLNPQPLNSVQML